MEKKYPIGMCIAIILLLTSCTCKYYESSQLSFRRNGKLYEIDRRKCVCNQVYKNKSYRDHSCVRVSELYINKNNRLRDRLLKHYDSTWIRKSNDSIMRGVLK